MGLFSKIKDNFQHGGVDVTLTAPPLVYGHAPSLDAQISLVAKEAKQINKITLKLVRIEQRNNSTTPNDQVATPMEQEYVVAENSVIQPFTLQPGQPVNIPITLALNFGTTTADMVGGNAVAETILKVANTMSSTRFHHELKATADVEGIALDPGAHQNITVQGVDL